LIIGNLFFGISYHTTNTTPAERRPEKQCQRRGTGSGHIVLRPTRIPHVGLWHTFSVRSGSTKFASTALCPLKVAEAGHFSQVFTGSFTEDSLYIARRSVCRRVTHICTNGDAGRRFREFLELFSMSRFGFRRKSSKRDNFWVNPTEKIGLTRQHHAGLTRQEQHLAWCCSCRVFGCDLFLFSHVGLWHTFSVRGGSTKFASRRIYTWTKAGFQSNSG